MDTQGDGLFAAFERARDAVLAAAAAQRSHAEHNWPDEEDVRLRMGLHTAEPHVWEEGYTGLGLTRAARICAAGHGGQVLLSRSTAGIVADDDFPGIAMRDLGGHRLKGLVWPEEIFELVIDGLDSDFPPLDTPEGAGPALETATVLVTDIDGLTNLSQAASSGRVSRTHCPVPPARAGGAGRSSKGSASWRSAIRVWRSSGPRWVQ